MIFPKYLFIEDNESDISTFRSTLERYSEEKKDRKPEIEYAVTLQDALSKLNNSFDGTIIDLKLNGDSNAGNEIIVRILDFCSLKIE